MKQESSTIADMDLARLLLQQQSQVGGESGSKQTSSRSRNLLVSCAHLAYPSMAPIDSLPPELLIYILHRALPPTPPSYSTFAARSRLLRSLALVSKAWTDIAQAELLAHPLVRTAKKLAMLEATVNQRKALRVRTLCAGDGGRTLHGGLVVDLLGKISPREVWLHTVNALVLNDLAGDAGTLLRPRRGDFERVR